ncbi:MAG: hypothetical protein JOZ96_24290 [Acidobacteria bacterium]|nr:hypothetical protein [Acidobacteriota bacterium]
MSKSLMLAVSFAAIIACSGVGKAPAPCESGVEANEYSVYSAAVEEFSRGRNAKSVVISNRTVDVSDPASVTSEWVRRCEAFVPEAEASFRDRNRQPLELTRSFTLRDDYVLVSAGDLKSIPSDKMRLGGMGAKYPDAFGVIGLSRVGFNAEMNKAVVYISQGSCGLGCGEGTCMMLVKEDCKWRVKGRSGVWMS